MSQAKLPNVGGRFPGLSRRLAVYVFGVAIGLVLMGLFQAAKKREAEAKRVEAATARDRPQTGGLFPELPAAERGK